VGTVIAFAGAYFSARLYMNLRPDFEELLPETTRSVVDFNEVAHRLSSVESIVVLIFSKNVEKSKSFAEALGKRLEKVPKEIIRSLPIGSVPSSNFSKTTNFSSWICRIWKGSETTFESELVGK